VPNSRSVQDREVAARLYFSALALARRGCAIFPCRLDKTPYTKHGFKEATTNLTQVEYWWRIHQGASIGIATSPVSGIFVLDIDNYHGGEASLRRLEHEHGELPHTVEVITGSGNGRHLYFRWPQHRMIRISQGRLGEGLDLRGAGGYVIAPPSPHESGRAYSWSVDSEKQFAEAPDWLLNKIAEPTCKNLVKTSGQKQRFPVFEGRIAESHRNSEIARASGLLLRLNVPADYVVAIMRSLNETQCEPPLPIEEVVRTVNSIAGAELRKRGRNNG
jgi:hypothetical protein